MWKKAVRALVLTVAACLFGCANPYDAEVQRLEAAENVPHPLEVNASDVFNRTTREHNPHRNDVTVEAPHIRKENFRSALAGYALKARKANRKGSTFEVWLEVVTSSSSWKHFNSAYSFGKYLSVETSTGTVGSCDQISCNLFETVAVTIPLTDLERSATSGGYELLISGSGGELQMKVPAPYIKGFLQKLRS